MRRIEDIGTHSIQKGAVRYLESLSGGPSTPILFIHLDCTMGHVNTIYMRYVTIGD